MTGKRHGRPLRSGHSAFGLVSVLALLALACCPVIAQADSGGAIYEEAESLPNPTGHHGEPPAKASTAPHNGGASAPPSTSPSQTGSDKSSSGGGQISSGETGGVATAHGGKGQGSPDKASSGALPKHSQPAVQTNASTSSGGSSSPLVPILIAIAVLAAISIGAVLIRQRRQRNGAGRQGSVSPRAS